MSDINMIIRAAVEEVEEGSSEAMTVVVKYAQHWAISQTVKPSDDDIKRFSSLLSAAVCEGARYASARRLLSASIAVIVSWWIMEEEDNHDG